MEAKEEEKQEGNKELDYEILREDFPNYDLSFKLIVIGNAGVGKSCLSMQATKKRFENNYLATVGFEFFVFNVKIDNKVLKLQIWDTCGQEVYRSLITSFYKNSSLAIIVYAINEEKSFEDIDLWIKDLRSNSSPDIKVFLIGNKADLEDERVISKEQALQVQKDFDLDLFMETSAKTGFNAQNLFVEAGRILYKEYTKFKKQPKISGEYLKKKELKKNKKKKCC